MGVSPGLNDSFEEEGYWWIAGREDQKIGGTLRFDPVNGPVLKLLGLLHDLVTSMNAALGANGTSTSTIYGVTTKGKPVTLLRAYNSNRQLNMPGIAHETWKANLLVIGIHLQNENDEIFDTAYVRFEGIEDWLGHRPFATIHDSDAKTITVVAGKPGQSYLADHADFKLDCAGSIYTQNEPHTRFTLDAMSYLSVEPKAPRSLNWHFETATKLQEMAALCAGHYLPLTSLELRRSEDADEAAGISPQEVHVYVRMRHPESGNRSKSDYPILSGPSLMELNPKAVQQWFDQYNLFSPAISLFFTVAGEREMFVNVRFLLAVQALEVFHRRTSADTIMLEEDFLSFAEALTKAIPQSAPVGMKDKLKGAYRYLNEPSLSQRLKTIAGDLKAAFGTAPPAFDKAYRRKLVDTRNYYTHFSSELEDKIFDSSGLYWASRRIVLLLTLLFLLRIGIPATKLTPFIERHQEFSKLWASSNDPY